MRLLLDTHAFVWAVLAPGLLGQQARDLIDSPRSQAFVSAVSLYEMSLKVRLGKWPEAISILAELDSIVQESNYTLLAVSPAHALRAGRLSLEHRDPFDRILAATALHEDFTVCSADKLLDAYGVQRIW